jgi:hypothetical protein
MHQPVHQEGRADHVARAFEKQDEEEQDQDLGQEGDDRADSGDRAVDDERSEQPRRKNIGDRRRQPGDARGDPVLRHLAPGEHGLEHDKHDQRKDHRPDHWMKQDAVEPVGPAPHRRFADHRRGGDFARPPLQVDEVAPDVRMDAAARCRKHVVNGGMEIADAALADRDGLDHRHAELALEHLRIELEPVAFGEVDHVQRDDRREPEFDQLQRETQVIVEIRGVEHDHQRVRLALAGLLAQQHVSGHRFVRARRIEAVGARKIDQLDRPAVLERQTPRMPLDRHARIIADLLARAGERVEQRALAGIGAAGDGNERERVHCLRGMTRTAPACLRRIATVIRPTRTAIGSRPNGPRCSGSTATPSSKPKCLRRQPSASSSAAQSIDRTRALVPTLSWSRLVVSGWKGAFILATDYH